MRGVSFTRVVTVLALAAAIVVVGLMLFARGGGDDYKVKARFQNASQVVKGGLVQISGKRVGEVAELDLTADGQAELTLSIKDEHAPLPADTIAEIRQFGLSGPASRYVDLRLPADRKDTIEDGGTLAANNTISQVEIDQLFSIYEPETRKGVTAAIRGSERQYYKPSPAGESQGKGFGKQANRGWLYLDPTLVASTRLFQELNRDTDELERFIVESSGLVGSLAERRDDLAGLVDNLADTTGAIARPRSGDGGALADAIHQLPPFMRRANTTYVNLRATLDDLDPLVEDAKPVVKKALPYVRELRFTVQDLQPTIEDLSYVIRRDGANNDLVELNQLQPRVRDIAVGPVQRNGEEREGALPAAAEALEGATPRVAFARPYSTDFMGWLDDFSHTGQYDALGSFSRVGSHFSAFSIKEGVLAPLAPTLRGSALREAAQIGHNNRCPGAAERDPGDGSTPFRPLADYNCDPTQIPLGP
jgi:phospholipid/cholesterol/gamma-HCH transport system substrate-binding protein